MNFLTINKSEVLRNYFLDYPTKEIHLRELSRKTGISFPRVREICLDLLKMGLISKRNEGGLVLLKANRDSVYFIAKKRGRNIELLYSSGLCDKLIDEYQRPEAIIVFGSYARAEDSEESDIDIAVITKKHKSFNIAEFEKMLKRKITIHEISKEKSDKEFLNTLANGIGLYGFYEVV